MFDSLRSALILAVSTAVMLMVVGCAPAAAPGDPEEGDKSVLPTPTATPIPSTPVSQTPPGDCWGGALPEEGIHCYVLEHSQMGGAITVVAIYEALNDVLHIFLDRTEPLDEELRVLFSEKATEYLDEGQQLHRSAFVWNDYNDGTQRGRLAPPSMEGYDQAILHIGGLKAVQSEPGWASWTQLWPGTSGSVRHDPGSGRAFDVSDIDTGKIPDPDCDELKSRSRVACKMWKRHPGSGVAGHHVDVSSREGTVLVYIQIKETLLPPSEEEQESLKQKLVSEDDLPWIDDITLIPVKYDFGELWRWATILDRFALSSGNTVGIVWALVDTNHFSYGGYLFPLDGWELADNTDSSTVRETVGIVVQNAQMAAEALPELLPLLGIPVDAVGVVRALDQHYDDIQAE